MSNAIIDSTANSVLNSAITYDVSSFYPDSTVLNSNGVNTTLLNAGNVENDSILTGGNVTVNANNETVIDTSNIANTTEEPENTFNMNEIFQHNDADAPTASEKKLDKAMMAGLIALSSFILTFLVSYPVGRMTSIESPIAFALGASFLICGLATLFYLAFA